MAITTLDGWIASTKERLTLAKFATRTVVASIWYSMFDVAGNPGAGTLGIGDTAAGTVPTASVAGYPGISAFGESATGYLSRIAFGNTVASRLKLFDRLFAAGAYAYNADTTLADQPSYAGRCPGSSYKGTQLWVEAVTDFTGNPSIQVNYLDQDGNAGDTGVIATGAALKAGRCLQLPLASGDSGVSQITRVRGTVASAGTFNVMVLRPLWQGRVCDVHDGDVHDFLRIGMPQIYATSALYFLVLADSTSSGMPDITLDVVNA